MVDVGIIGIGKMGLPIALNLMDRGFAVTGHRRTGSPELEAAGGRSVSSSAEVADASDVLITILPDADAVEQVILGPGGTLESLRAGTVHIEMSTIDVEHKMRLRDHLVAAGGEMLDAPISGGPMMVAPRLAVVFASGTDAAIEQVRPVLDAIGPWVPTGPFGTGGRTKYLANMLLAVHLAGAAEALALAREWGLDLGVLQATLDSSIAGSAIMKQRAPAMHGRSYLPAPGPVGTLRDVLDQVARAAEKTGATTPVFTAARGVFDRAAELGWSHLDVASVHDLAAGLDALDAGSPDPPPARGA